MSEEFNKEELKKELAKRIIEGDKVSGGGFITGIYKAAKGGSAGEVAANVADGLVNIAGSVAISELLHNKGWLGWK